MTSHYFKQTAMNDYDSPYALIEAVLFVEANPELSFRIEEETRLIVSPIEAAKKRAARIRELKTPLLDIIEAEWNRYLATRLIDQMHMYVIHVVLAKGMVETLEYIDAALGAQELTILQADQQAIEARIDRAAEEEDWTGLRKNVARYVAFWRSAHKERIESEEAMAA